jgi:hypothetical protein
MLTEFKAAITSAMTFSTAGDYVTALIHARTARIALMGIPDSELDREKIAYSRDDMDAMIRDLQRAASAQQSAESGGPFSSTDIVYTRH